MTAQHTRAPWNLQGEMTYDESGHYIGGLAIEGDDNIIAEITPWQSPLEAQANAHLLVAAPKLLEALQDAREWVVNGEVDGVDCDELLVIEILDAAIAEATGRAS